MDHLVLVRDRDSFEDVMERFRQMDINEQSSPSVKIHYSVLITRKRSKEVIKILRTLPHDKNLTDLVVTNVIGKLSLQNVFHEMYPSVTKLVFINCGLQSLPETLGRSFPNVRDLIVTDNAIKMVPDCVGTLRNLQSLHISRNRLKEVPDTIGQLRNLKELYCAHNKLATLPASLCNLSGSLMEVDVRHNLISALPFAIVSVMRQALVFHCSDNPLTRRLPDKKEAIASYLEELEAGGKALNNEVKLAVVGDETVGKTTLTKALRRKDGVCKEVVDKTDGIEIGILEIDGIKFRIFDTAGDVDFLETHLLFTSPNCLYLNVFNLATTGIEGQTGSQLGRLQLWLNSIYTQAPNSRNLIVGTHADGTRHGKEVKGDIKERLKKILEKAHQAHRQRFVEETLEECVLCQDDLRFGVDTKGPSSSELKEEYNASNVHSASKEEQAASDHSVGSAERLQAGTSPICANIPHIVGYHEVSSVKKYPFTLFGENPSVKKLKDALLVQARKLLQDFPDKPKKWVDVLQELVRLSTQEDELPVMVVDAVRRIAEQYGVTEEHKFLLMLKFFANIGDIIYHERVPDVVVLDPEWLAEELSSLISFKQDWFEDGVLKLEDLKKAWKHMSEKNREDLLRLFRHFRICFPIDDTRELFPCRLPVGMPHPSFWAPVPEKEERQVSYLCRLSFIPSVFFPEIVVEVNRNEDVVDPPKPRFFCNRILYETREEPANCHNCQGVPPEDHGKHHRVHIELLHPQNAVMVTVRGPRPCCIAKRLCNMIKSIAGENVIVKFSLLCPQCVVESADCPMSLKTSQGHPLSCDNGHRVGMVSDVLQGKVLFSPKSTQVIQCDVVDNTHCPGLFVILPVNQEALSFLEYIQYTILKDGFAVHFLCEQPGEWHFLSTPGFPLRRVEKFVKAYGGRAYKVLEQIVTEDVSASAVDSICISLRRKEACCSLKFLLDSFRRNFPDMARNAGVINLQEPTLAENLTRSRLKKLLNISDEEDQPAFPELYPTQVKDRVRWLCFKHHQAVAVKDTKARMSEHFLTDPEDKAFDHSTAPVHEANGGRQTPQSNSQTSQVNIVYLISFLSRFCGS